jgi:hypothetical protein
METESKILLIRLKIISIKKIKILFNYKIVEFKLEYEPS